MSNSQEQQQPVENDAFVRVVTALLAVVCVLVLLPALVPFLASRIVGTAIATKWRFWVVPSWWWILNTAGAVVFAGVLVWEVFTISGWVQSGGFDRLKLEQDWPVAALGMAWPWLLLNLLLGFLLVPLVVSVRRRKLRQLTRLRRIPDVARQDDIERAQMRANDFVSGQRIGVKVNQRDGTLRGSATQTAPMDVGDGSQAVGIRTRDTVRNLSERFKDTRTLADWVSDDDRYVVAPKALSALRAVLLAESGSGKTVLINNLIAAALKNGVRVFFIDGKGAPEDADSTAGVARALGYTATVGQKWNLFDGTPEQIRSKLLRLWAETNTDGSYYREKGVAALTALQSKSPFRSTEDLRDRLQNPAPHVQSQADVTELMKVASAKTGETIADNVWSSMYAKILPLQPFIAEDGWSFANATADLTIVPLAPIDPAQKKLGDLILYDLRNYLAARLAARDKTPVLVIVDEFAQLVGDDVDAGDTATSLFETCRSAGMGLLIAAQSPVGLSQDADTRRRVLSSGAALIVGRSKDPEEVSMMSGTRTRMEASGGAQGDELRSGRSQHTFVLPPDHVRQASVGSFWIVQAGSVVPFRALPTVAPKFEDPSYVDQSDAAKENEAVASEIADTTATV